jgi:hypothetical protein
MDKTIANSYRSSAARCRKAALSSSNPKEWIAKAEQWELTAANEEALRILPSKGRNKGEPSSGRTNGSAAPGFHDPLDWVP